MKRFFQSLKPTDALASTGKAATTAIDSLASNPSFPRSEDTKLSQISPQESSFFTTGLSAHASRSRSAVMVPWEARAVEIGAQRLPLQLYAERLVQLWCEDIFMQPLTPGGLRELSTFFVFAKIPALRDVIRQGEPGCFMVVVINGEVSIDRRQPWGERIRLAQTRPGDMLGEMSLIDSGARFSHCTTRTACEVAVLTTEALDDMLVKAPDLTARFVSSLARKLSTRLRAMSVRLDDRSMTP